MPFVNDGSGDLVQQALALSQLVQARRERQGQNTLDRANPGDTFAKIGMDAKTYQALYGKNAKYDPNAVVKQETSQHFLDIDLLGRLQGMSPQSLANIQAGLLNQRQGTPGATTMAGLDAASEAGGRAATLVNETGKATYNDNLQTGIDKAATAKTDAVRAKVTSEDVMTRTIAGIESWKLAPKDTQTALNQKLTYGTTTNEVDQNEYKARLATSSIKQAIIAQSDPHHPIHKFLSKFGLDLNTVLAGTAMGLDTMFTDWARYSETSATQSKETDQIMLRMYAEDAKQLSLNIFKGKVTAGQVLSIMRNREDGTPLPKGLEEASKVYDLAVQANFDAVMQEALTKGDPFLAGIQQQIQFMSKLTDPRDLASVSQLTQLAAARAATLKQLGTPTTADEAKRFDVVMQKNLQRATTVHYNAPWFGANSLQVDDPSAASAGLPAGMPAPVVDALKPRGGMPGAVPGTAPVAPKPPSGLLVPPGAAAGTPNPVAAGAATLTPEDQKAIADYLQLIGGAGAGPKKPPQ